MVMYHKFELNSIVSEQYLNQPAPGVWRGAQPSIARKGMALDRRHLSCARNVL